MPAGSADTLQRKVYESTTIVQVEYDHEGRREPNGTFIHRSSGLPQIFPDACRRPVHQSAKICVICGYIPLTPFVRGAFASWKCAFVPYLGNAVKIEWSATNK